MKIRKPHPGAAIATGLLVIGFALLYRSVGVFAYRSGWRNRSIVASEEPEKFTVAVGVALVAGAVTLVWGLARSGKD